MVTYTVQHLQKTGLLTLLCISSLQPTLILEIILKIIETAVGQPETVILFLTDMNTGEVYPS
jgi:hypothetical protein